MPLYEHTTTGQRVYTVAGGHEDNRLRASPDWHDPQKPASEPEPVEVEGVDDGSTDPYPVAWAEYQSG